MNFICLSMVVLLLAVGIVGQGQDGEGDLSSATGDATGAADPQENPSANLGTALGENEQDDASAPGPDNNVGATAPGGDSSGGDGGGDGDNDGGGNEDDGAAAPGNGNSNDHGVLPVDGDGGDVDDGGDDDGDGGATAPGNDNSNDAGATAPGGDDGDGDAGVGDGGGGGDDDGDGGAAAPGNGNSNDVVLPEDGDGGEDDGGGGAAAPGDGNSNDHGKLPGDGVFFDAVPDPSQPVIRAIEATVNFGKSVDVSDDYIIVGDPDKEGTTGGEADGWAFLYNRQTRAFIDKFVPERENERFGESVAVEGEVLVIGAPKHEIAPNDIRGAVYIYQKFGVDWLLVNKFTGESNNDEFGFSVAIDSGAAIIAVGAPAAEAEGYTNNGKVYIYERSGDDAWQETKKIVNWDIGLHHIYMGNSIDIDGDTLVTGGRTVYVTTHQRWRFISKATYSGNNPIVAISGENIAVGNQHSNGQNYIYLYKSSLSSPIRTIRGPDNSKFGQSIDITRNIMAVGAPEHSSNSGTGYIYINVGTEYAEDEVADATVVIGGKFGTSVAVHEDGMVIFGEPNDKDINGFEKGSIQIYSACDGKNDRIWVKTADSSIGQNGCGAGDYLGSTSPILTAEACQNWCLNTGQFRYADAVELEVEGSVNKCSCFSTCDKQRSSYTNNVEVYELQCTDWTPPPTEPDLRVFHQPVTKFYQSGVERPSGEQFGQTIAADDTYLVVGDYNFEGKGRVHVYNKDTFALVATIDRPDAEVATEFGFSVDISRTLLVIGAPLGDSSVFVFNEATTGNWVLQQTLVNPDSPTQIKFGYTVGVHAYTDQSLDRIYVGAPDKSNEGAVYKYTRNIETNWVLGSPYMNAPSGHNTRFGSALAVGDGFVVATSDRSCQLVYYINDGSPQFSSIASCSTSNDYEKALSINGQELAVGDQSRSAEKGQVQIYTRTQTGVISRTDTLEGFGTIASSRFGASVSLAGDYLLVGAPGSDDWTGQVNLFYRTNSKWSEETIRPESRLTGMKFGVTLAITTDGAIFVGSPEDLTPDSPRNGAIYKYQACGSLVWEAISYVTADPNDQPGCQEDEITFQTGSIDLDACKTFCMTGRPDLLFISLDSNNRCDCYGDTCTLNRYSFFSPATYYQLKCSEDFNPAPQDPSDPPTSSGDPAEDSSASVSITFVTLPDLTLLKTDLATLLNTIYSGFPANRLTLTTSDNTVTVQISAGVPTSQMTADQLKQLLAGDLTTYSTLNGNIMEGSVMCSGCPIATCPTNGPLIVTESPALLISQSGFFTKDLLTLQYHVQKLFDSFELVWEAGSSLNYPQDPNTNYALDTGLPCADILTFTAPWNAINDLANGVSDISDASSHIFEFSQVFTATEPVAYGQGVVQTNVARPIKKKVRIKAIFPKFGEISSQVQVVGGTINSEAIISADTVDTDPAGGILNAYKAHATLLLETTVVGFYKFSSASSISATSADLQNNDLSITMTDETGCTPGGALCVQTWTIQVYSTSLCKFGGNLNIMTTMTCQTASNCPLDGGEDIVDIGVNFSTDDGCVIDDVPLDAVSITLIAYSSDTFATEDIETDFISGQRTYFEVVATSTEVSFTPVVDKVWVTVGPTSTDVISAGGVSNDPVPADISFTYISQVADIRFRFDLVPGFFPPTTEGTPVTVHVKLSLGAFGTKLLEMDASLPVLLQKSDTFIDGSTFFNVRPCLDDHEWRSEWGYCKDYEVDRQNHGYCNHDHGVEANGTRARVACPNACGICKDYSVADDYKPVDEQPEESPPNPTAGGNKNCSDIEEWTDYFGNDCSVYQVNTAFCEIADPSGCCICGGGISV